MSEALELIVPDWPAPATVRACSSTRLGGVSRQAWQGLNLGLHVDDDADAVEQNRYLLKSAAKLPAEPLWLNQVHAAA
ncbi:MAG: laccase domain-containing protein, partial [Gammaproteobacteria bacterium]|nr:laccase domain-containing protein [Gammaproteobacteria bacterium]